MFIPFALFTRPLLEAYVKAGKTFFVRQSFVDAKQQYGENCKGCFLVSHYTEIGHAQHHYGAIAQDPYKYLYNWNEKADREKLTSAAAQPAGYRIFASVFREDWQKEITTEWKQNLRRYIEGAVKQKPSVYEPVDFEIYVHYGELYARFKLRNQEVRVKLAEIENYR